MWVFVDTSVFVAALLSDRGASSYILEHASFVGVKLVTSEYVIEEWHATVLSKFPSKYSRLLDLLIALDIEVVRTPARPTLLKYQRLMSDAKDVPILAAFIKSPARYLISLDKDFLRLTLPIKTILTPGDFLMQLRAVSWQKWLPRGSWFGSPELFNGLRQHTGIQIQTHGRDRAGLGAAQHIPRAANFKVFHGEC